MLCPCSIPHRLAQPFYALTACNSLQPAYPGTFAWKLALTIDGPLFPHNNAAAILTVDQVSHGVTTPGQWGHQKDFH